MTKINEVARLNRLLDNLYIQGLEVEKVKQFISMKEQVENALLKYQDDIAAVGVEYNATFDENQQLVSDNNEEAIAKFQSIVQAEYPIETNIFTVDELMGMVAQGVTGGDLSFLSKALTDIKVQKVRGTNMTPPKKKRK